MDKKNIFFIFDINNKKCLFLISKLKRVYTKFICLIIIIFIHTNFYFLAELEFKNKNIKKNKNKINLSEIFSKFISYSQHLEDLVLYSIFYDVKNGFYIDVGAHDPNFISVTKAFYLLGWYGINIEPLPEKYKALQSSRKRDINLNLGIGEKKGIAILNIDTKCKACTFILKRKNNNTNRYRYLNITINTMSNICKKYVPKKE